MRNNSSRDLREHIDIGLNDGDEVFTHFTRPILADTDHDLIRDDEELVAGADGFITDPTNGDTDGALRRSPGRLPDRR